MAGSKRDGHQGIRGDSDGQAGLSGEERVESREQGSAPNQRESGANEVSRELGWCAFEHVFRRRDDLFQGSRQRTSDLRRRHDCPPQEP